jgi:hypothetical protein
MTWGCSDAAGVKQQEESTLTERGNKGRWKPGSSGNPGGRKPGTGVVAKVRESIAKDVPSIVAAMVKAAKGGDVGAARLLLERTVAPLKAAEENVALVLEGATLTEQGRSVLRAIADGTVAPSQGSQILTSIGALARVTETDEFERRIRALEAGREHRGDSR